MMLAVNVMGIIPRALAVTVCQTLAQSMMHAVSVAVTIPRALAVTVCQTPAQSLMNAVFVVEMAPRAQQQHLHPLVSQLRLVCNSYLDPDTLARMMVAQMFRLIFAKGTDGIALHSMTDTGIGTSSRICRNALCLSVGKSVIRSALRQDRDMTVKRVHVQQ
jgi:hypothetical protein